MGRLSPGSSWARRLFLLVAAGARLAHSSLIAGIGRLAAAEGTSVAGRTAAIAVSRQTNSKGSRTLRLTAPAALQVIGRIAAAVKDGGEGVVTGTARVRYWDARRGRFARWVKARLTLPFRAGRQGAIALVLPASGRAPMAAGWTPVASGGIARAALPATRTH